MADLNEKYLGNDIMELAKVWNNLSEDMQFLLAKAIAGEEYAEGTKAMISEMGEI